MAGVRGRASLGGSLELFNKASPIRRGSLQRSSLFARSLSFRASLNIFSFGNHQASEPSVENVPRNENWNSVQVAILQLFQREKLTTGELAALYTNVLNLVSSNVGPFLFEYYRNEVLKRGLANLRDYVHVDNHNENEETCGLMGRLSDTWNYFYCEILPILQAILDPIQTKNYTVRQASLLEFRDTVLFNSSSKVFLESDEMSKISPAIEQMLLVLQSIQDDSRPSASYLRLERLTGRYIVPYLGLNGLYMGHDEPEIPSLIQPYTQQDTSSTHTSVHKRDILHSHSSSSLQRLRQHRRQSSLQLVSPGMDLLAPLIEQDNTERRHSFSVMEDNSAAAKFTIR